MLIRKHHNVNIYTKEGSMLSDLAKKFFAEAGIDFTEFNISKSKEYESELLSISSDVIIPTVDFDGRIITGYQPDVYSLLIKAGEAAEKKADENSRE